MCIYSAQQIKDMINPIAAEYGLDTVFLFGSYARNEATENSDIDLYVPTLPAQMGLRFFSMYEKIKEITEKEVDIITDDSVFISPEEKQNLFTNLNKDKVKIYG